MTIGSFSWRGWEIPITSIECRLTYNKLNDIPIAPGAVEWSGDNTFDLGRFVISKYCYLDGSVASDEDSDQPSIDIAVEATLGLSDGLQALHNPNLLDELAKHGDVTVDMERLPYARDRTYTVTFRGYTGNGTIKITDRSYRSAVGRTHAAVMAALEYNGLY